MEVPTEFLDKSLLEFNNLLSPANLLIMKPLMERARPLILKGKEKRAAPKTERPKGKAQGRVVYSLFLLSRYALSL